MVPGPDTVALVGNKSHDESSPADVALESHLEETLATNWSFDSQN